jgi:hypothetical protein
VTPVPSTIKLGAVEEFPTGASGDAANPAGLTTDETEEAPASLPPVTLLENYRTAFRQYAAKLGGHPVGDNAEIIAALKGGNAREAVFLTPSDGLKLNSAGEAVDSWGTPYFFHQLSGAETEIRSAGPDRRMWTSDDLVLK